MTTLTLTPLPEIAAVRLVIASAPAGPVTITRNDHSGTALVRLRAGQEPLGGALVVIDYEPALLGPLTYTVTDSAAGEVTQTTTLTEPVRGEPVRPILIVPVRPQRRHRAEAVTGYTHRREVSGRTHYPIGRISPITVSQGPMRLPSGSVTLYAATYADALSIEDALSTGEVVLLRQADHAGMDSYFVATDTTVSVLRAQRDTISWQVRADFDAVDSPDTPLLGGAGWTWADVVANYSSSTAVNLAFGNFTGLAVGP